MKFAHIFNKNFKENDDNKNKVRTRKHYLLYCINNIINTIS